MRQKWLFLIFFTGFVILTLACRTADTIINWRVASAQARAEENPSPEVEEVVWAVTDTPTLEPTATSTPTTTPTMTPTRTPTHRPRPTVTPKPTGTPTPTLMGVPAPEIRGGALANGDWRLYLVNWDQVMENGHQVKYLSTWGSQEPDNGSAAWPRSGELDVPCRSQLKVKTFNASGQSSVTSFITGRCPASETSLPPPPPPTETPLPTAPPPTGPPASATPTTTPTLAPSPTPTPTRTATPTMTVTVPPPPPTETPGPSPTPTRTATSGPSPTPTRTPTPPPPPTATP